MSQLTNYIQKELDKGFSQDLISKKLLQAGYTKQEISESFQSLKSAEPLLRRKSIEIPHMEFHVKWSKWVFGFLALVLVAVFGYLIYLYEGEITLPKPIEETKCDTLTSLEEKDNCFLELAANGEEVCEKIHSFALKTSCEDKIWKTDTCSYLIITGKDYKQCLWDKAIETKDATYCSKIIDQRSECFYQLAFELHDASVCQFEFTCYQEYAVATKEREVCALIWDKGLIKECYNFYDTSTT